MQLRAVVKWGRRNAIKQDQDVPATGSKMPRLPRTTNKISFFSRTWKYFVDALASLDFKLSVTESVIAWFCVDLRWLYNIFVYLYALCEDIFGICVYLASRQKYELQ